ncbi:MAG: (Fe-S)-binding protein [Reyranella sp.]|nr:(Fe-S)-binding protein [Reyranella sp.]
MPAAATNAFPLGSADLCVKCGLCLPHCPTYLDNRQEGDSPRGRIALMQGLATGAIPLTPRLEAHLDGCLDCRACEPVCPAQVPFGALIDAGRALLAQRRPRRTRTLAAVSAVLSSRLPRQAAAWLAWIYQNSGVQKLVRRLHLLGHGRLARLESLLPALAPPRAPRLAAGSGGRTVQLFAGCVTAVAERTVLEDAARLFAACGWRVELPPRQTCCGALDQHGGRTDAAARLARRNLAAFAGGQGPLVAIASGCAATLGEYAALAPGAQAAAFAARVRDPGRLLLDAAAPLQFRPLPARVALHMPCTLRNVVGERDAWRRLLARIPQLELVELDPSERCCGAAGLHFVTRPEAADRLLEPKIDAARRLAPQIVASANVGCSLHLAAGLRRAGLQAQVLHPLALLARQLA